MLIIDLQGFFILGFDDFYHFPTLSFGNYGAFLARATARFHKLLKLSLWLLLLQKESTEKTKNGII